jgi:drug/metabolite transporter (DMT)-like permease
MIETPAGPAGVPVSGRPSRARIPFTARQRLVAEVGLLLVMISWAVNFITVKGTGGQIPPMTFAWVRFTAAGILLLGLLRWREGAVRLRRADVWPMILLGVIGFGVYQVLWASAIQLISAGDSALLIATTPVIAVLMAVVARSDTLTAPKVAGAVLSFAGVAVVVGGGGSGDAFSLVGYLVTLAAAVCWAIYTSFGAPVLRRNSPLAVAAWAVVFGALFLAPFGVVAAFDADWSRVEPIAYGGWIYSGLIAAGIANVVMYDGIRVLGPARAVAFQFLVPLFAVVIGALVLAEPIRPDQVAGGLIIVAGVLLTRRGSGGRSPERESGTPSFPPE